MDTPCELRPGNPNRYPRKWAGGRYLMSYHRWVYEQAHGPVPDGWVVDHLCRNKRCVSLEHLEAVPVGENNRRGASFDKFLEAGRAWRERLREERRFGGRTLNPAEGEVGSGAE